MTVTLKITVSFDKSVDDYLDKTIEIPDKLATEKHIKNGQAGVRLQDEEVVKITYRGAFLELPRSEIRVLTVEEKSVFDYC